MLDKQMQDGLSIIDDIWVNCVNIILGLIEDSLFDQENTITKKSTSQYKIQEHKLFKGQQLGSLSPTESIKRKRRFSDDRNNKKLQKLSDDLANDIARHLNVSSTLDVAMDFIDLNRSPQYHSPSSSSSTTKDSFLNTCQRSTSLSPLLPTLRRMSTNGYHNDDDDDDDDDDDGDGDDDDDGDGDHQYYHHPSTSTSLKSITTTNHHPKPSTELIFSKVGMDFILQKAKQLGISTDEYKQQFEKQRNQFHQYMIQLQHLVNHDHVTFDEIKSFLQVILNLAEEMMLMGNHSISFMDIFPEWKLWEGFVQKLVTYIQCIDDMRLLTTEKLHPFNNNDLSQIIKSIYQLLETRKSLYGDILIQNGLEWKAIGLPVDMQLINTVKQWFLYVCISLLDELDIACPSNHSKDHTQFMENLLLGLEVVSGIIAFCGVSSKKVNINSQILATVYTQWISDNLEYMNESQTKKHHEPFIKKTNSTLSSSSTSSSSSNSNNSPHHNNDIDNGKIGRIDLRLMELLEYMGRIIDVLQIIHDNEKHIINNNHNRMMDDMKEIDDFNLLETIADMFVEITVRTIAVIETQRFIGQKGKGITNIMSVSSQSSFIYMEESLLTFAEKIVELAGREWIDRPKLQRLHAYFEKMETELTEND